MACLGGLFGLAARALLLLGLVASLFLGAVSGLFGLADLAVLFLALAALFLFGLAACVFLGARSSLDGLLLLALLLHRRLTLGDLGSECLADLVHVRLDQRRRVVLGGDLELSEPVEKLLARHAELFGELVHPHCWHCLTVPDASFAQRAARRCLVGA